MQLKLKYKSRSNTKAIYFAKQVIFIQIWRKNAARSCNGGQAILISWANQQMWSVEYRKEKLGRDKTAGLVDVATTLKADNCEQYK